MAGAYTMTYDSLVVDIKDFIQRGNAQDTAVVRQIPRQIANVQRTLADQLKIQGYIGAYTSAMQTGQPIIAKPDNWRSTVSINFGDGALNNDRTFLLARSLEWMRSVYPNDTELNAPKFYCDYDLQHWLVSPAPADDYPFEAIVWRMPPLLSEENQQNYLTQYAPNLLLYSTLVAMEPFLRNDARMATWKVLAKENFDAINIEDIQRMVDRGAVRRGD